MNINKQAMDIEKLAKNIDDALQQASQEYQCPERKFTIEEAIKISKIIVVKIFKGHTKDKATQKQTG